MAKINFKKQPLLNLNQEQMNRIELDENKQEKRIPLTLADIIEMNLTKEDDKCTPLERFNRFLVSDKIQKTEGEVDLTVEELGLIKKIIGENPSPLIVGRVWSYIESELADKK